MSLRWVVLLGALAALAACGDPRSARPAAPPRASDPIVFPAEPSVVAVDLRIDLAGLEREIERDLPRQLWTVSQEDVVCVPSGKIDLALFKLKTPKLKCDIEGKVTRGRVRVAGRGQELVLRVPIKAVLVARDIGGILKQETATAALDLRLGLKLDLAANWRLKGDVAVDYSWSEEPGIDFLGRRITLTGKADETLAPLKAKVEEGLERALARVQLRAAAERGWRAAHTVLELNRENPSVWGRINPRRFQYGGYRIAGQRMWMTLGLEGTLETWVGDPPPPPQAGPLPDIAPLAVKPGFAVLKVPVVADYAVLEPVIAKALAKRALRPFALGEYGNVTASFADVEVYGTEGNRIAVGITFDAKSDITVLPRARGRLWLTAKPINAPNSRAVGFTEAAITGETDMVGQDLLFALANSEQLRTAIADALKQNFENDFAKLRGKIDRAIARRTDGPVRYTTTLEKIDTGRIEAYGQGLYLPVELHARISAELIKME